MKILFVTPYTTDHNGGSIGRLSNYLALEALNYKLESFPINVNTNKFNKIINTLLNYKCGLNFFIKIKLLLLIKKNKYSSIFFDTSLYGHTHKLIKLFYPRIKIITFFHNCEYVIYRESLFNKSFFYEKFLLNSVAYNEKRALKYSDSCIFLTQRDKETCFDIYNQEPKSSKLSPIALQNTYTPPISSKMQFPHTLLFVGSYFYPNIQGLLWFCNEVLPHINYQLKIVGKHFEKQEFTNKINDTSKISFLGFVENLDIMYEASDIVIQPIFKGSGMKTKTAECFLYGKPLISSSEGLVGYKYNDLQNVFCCETKEEYLATLRRLKDQELPSFDNELYERFLNLYSIDSRKIIFSEIIKELL